VHVAGVRLVREDQPLRRAVGVERAVPVDMIGREVEQHRDPWVERLLLDELEGGGLDHEDVVFLERGRREGPTDVAARHHVERPRPQTGREHPGGRRLAVRPRDRDVRDAREPGPELELTPDRQPALPRPAEHLGRRRDAGARHDEGGVVQIGRIVAAGADLDPQRLHRIHLGERGPVARFGHAHRRAFQDERARRGASRDPGPDHHGVLAVEAPSAHPSPPRAMKSA
jgi:hypothetical protein